MDVEQVRAAMARRGFGVRATARRIHYDHAMLSRVLRGQQRPSAVLEAALTALLDLDDDDARLNHVAAHPARLDGAATEALAGALAAQRRADDVVGPAPLLAGAEAHRETLQAMLRNARGPQRNALAEVVAEHSAFLGWLYVQMRSDRALPICREAEKLATEIGHGPLSAQALNFAACHWRARGDHRSSVETLRAVCETDGVHPTQKAANLARLAEETASMGDKTAARATLRQAETLAEKAAALAPDPAAYWLSGMAFHWLNQGNAHKALGDEKAAREHLAAGLAGVPAEHLSAPWINDYVRSGQLRELSPS